MTAGSSRSRRCETLAMSRWFSMMSRNVCDAVAVQLQPFRGAHRHLRADFGVFAFFVDFRFADVVQQQRQIKQTRGVPVPETAARNLHTARPSPPTSCPVVRGKRACARRRRIDGKIRAARGRSACRIRECICRADSPRAWRAESARPRRGVRESSGKFRGRARRSENRGPPATSSLRMSCARSGCSFKPRCCAWRKTRINRRGDRGKCGWRPRESRRSRT